MRNLIHSVAALLLALAILAPSAALELTAEFYSRFGTDFVEAEVEGGGGDGDGVYFGEALLRPRAIWSFSEFGRLSGAFEARLDERLEELELELTEAFAEISFDGLESLRAGLHDLRWGDDGLYNRELGGASPRGTIYEARPLGLRVGHAYDSLNYEAVLGLSDVAGGGDTLLAGIRLGYVGDGFTLDLFGLIDSRPYDARALFFEQYTSRAPGVRRIVVPPGWTYRRLQFSEELTTRYDPLQTLALGLTLSGGSDSVTYRLNLAYHSFRDIDDEASSGHETGGSRLFIYPEVRLRENWFDGYVAAHVDYWNSHDADGLNTVNPYQFDPISSTLAYELYLEPGVLLGDNWRVSLGAGYVEPSTKGVNLPDTDADESLDASFFVGPRVEWFTVAPGGHLRMILGGTYRQWSVALYNVEDTGVDESREITLWLRAEATF